MVESNSRSFGNPEQSEQHHPQDPQRDQEQPEIPHASTLVKTPEPTNIFARFLAKFTSEDPKNLTQPEQQPISNQGPVEHTPFQPQSIDTSLSLGDPQMSPSAAEVEHSQTTSDIQRDNASAEPDSSTTPEDVSIGMSEKQKGNGHNTPITMIRGMFSRIRTTTDEPDEYKNIRGARMSRRTLLKATAGVAGGMLATQLKPLENLASAQEPEEENPQPTPEQSETETHEPTEPATPEVTETPDTGEDEKTSEETTDPNTENPPQEESPAPSEETTNEEQSEDVQAIEQSTSIESREYDRPFENNVGWAYQPRHYRTRDQIFADMRDMKDRGCNSLYVGHSNPGDSRHDKTEPGLNFSVYNSIMTNEGNTGESGRMIMEKITDVLDAAKECGMQVVLPVGYKISMGPQWSERNPNQLRKDADGQDLHTWGTEQTASPYSEKYKQDIRTYYQWINDTILSKYDNIKAINIADEPMGGDFSPHAMDEFRRKYGVDYHSASDEQRGEFQQNVIPDYIIWSAKTWKDINPNMLTTATIHIQREKPFSFDVERMFSETPDTFMFSADTHLQDAPPDNFPMTKDSTKLLINMVRTLGLYSKIYNKQLMLWQGANAWSFDRDGIQPDMGIHTPQQAADINLQIIHDRVKQAGGKIAMIFGWGHPNVQPEDQILTGISPDTMYDHVTARLSGVRDRLSEVSQSLPRRIITIPRNQINQVTSRTRGKDGEHVIDTSDIYNLANIDFEHEDVVVIPEGKAAQIAKQHGSQVESVDGKHLQGLPDRLIQLPGDVKELEAGKTWLGEPPEYLNDAVRDLKQKYEARGINWIKQFGLFKGCMYFKGGDNNYWPYMVFERAVLHPVADRFELSLTNRDLANGKVELGEGNRDFAELSPQAQEQLRTIPVIGDEHSEAPSFTNFRKYMTVNGDNKDPDMSGQFADLSLDKNGNLSHRPEGMNNEKFRYVHYDEGTGHNIPKAIFDEITSRFGNTEQDWWPEIGRPISNPYWVHTQVGENNGSPNMQWVLTQMFERGTMTYHPEYEDKGTQEWVTQGALTGNHFLKVFQGGKEDPYKQEYHNMFS